MLKGFKMFRAFAWKSLPPNRYFLEGVIFHPTFYALQGTRNCW